MLREDGQGTPISIRATPKSGKNAVVGAKNNRLLIAVRAAPQDGAANAAVIETLSAFLGYAKSNLVIVRGHKNREKTVHVAAMNLLQVAEKLGAN
ncbi:hypothetical protein B1R32_10325 [Abditibacterium utsteinense]|uniref:UPF0235 protein B1R32_10325 n=2 Tax=Abditibacterium utsteinense TaxID=1960156 RepID=A0A2S8SVD6_9BACT|nr:hypothetical protein B1R32_10325 [Abditibacterium utsteinense]